MQNHRVRVHRSEEGLSREGQLAWAIAQVAADPVEVGDDVVDMIVNRIIDNAGVAAASVGRGAPSAAREQAVAHPPSSGGAGATVFGREADLRMSPEWAALPTESPCASWTFTTPSWPPTIRTPATTSRRSSPLPSTWAPTGTRWFGVSRRAMRYRSILFAVDQPAQAQDRPRRTPRPVGGGRHRDAAGAAAGGRLPGDRPSASHHDGHPTVAQRRDLLVEGVCTRIRGQGRGRGGRSARCGDRRARRRSTKAKTA